MAGLECDQCPVSAHCGEGSYRQSRDFKLSVPEGGLAQHIDESVEHNRTGFHNVRAA